MRRQATSLSKEKVTQSEFESQAFFTVMETDALHYDLYGNLTKISDKKVLVKADGSYISTVGRNYSIVDNEKYFTGVITALQEGNVDYVPQRVYTEANGKRTTMIVKLPQFGMFLNSPEQQDFELRIRNSFDATLAADTILGFLRLICTNGMTTYDQQFNYRMLHKGDIVTKAEDAIMLYKNFEGIWTRTKEQIEVMNDSFGNKRAVAKYIGDGEVTLNGMFKGERWAKNLLNKWQEEGEPTNLWNLYNMMTNIISHGYGHNYSSKLNKMQELNKEVKNWNNILEVERAIPVYSIPSYAEIKGESYYAQI